MKHLKTFNEAFEEVKKTSSVYEIGDRLAPILQMFIDLNMFNICIVYTDHFVAKFKDSSSDEEFQVFIDHDHSGEWLCIEYNTKTKSNVADSMEAGTMSDIVNYMKKRANMNDVAIWKSLIRKNPAYSIECPVEILKRINPKIGKMKDTGMFED
jgi:hypothetical protein